MTTNRSKFQAIFLDKYLSDTAMHIKGHSITPVTVVKLLGVHLDKSQFWIPGIKIVCAKTCKQLNALKRLVRFINIKAKLTIFRTSDIRCYLMYYSVILLWQSELARQKLKKFKREHLDVLISISTIIMTSPSQIKIMS